MKKKSKIQDYNSNLIDSIETNEKFFEQDEKKKKAEREKKIKEINKAKKKEYDSFDLETETVIGMTNKNNKEKTNQKKKAMSKKQRELQKKKKRLKLVLSIFTCLILIAVTSIIAFVSPIFNIKKIEVVDNKQISSEMVTSLSGLKIDTNIFKFFSKDIEKNIKENAYVESVSISRKLPSTVKISVKEREKKFNVQILNSYAYIDEQGNILEISQEKSDFPVITGVKTAEENITPGNRLEMEDLKKLEVVINILKLAKKDNFSDKITSIDISNENEYILSLEEEQKEIYLGNATNLKDRMIWVPEILEAEKGKAGKILVNGDFNNKFRAYFREDV